MKISDIINEAITKKECRFAFEILPPLKGEKVDTLLEVVDTLKKYNPAFINITSHREDKTILKDSDGKLKEVYLKQRTGTIALASVIKKTFEIEVASHIICAGNRKEDLENQLIDLSFLGLENVVALQGDASKHEQVFSSQKGGHNFASELVLQIANLNKGEYLYPLKRENNAKRESNIMKCNFAIGVAGYPEKHIAAPNMEVDIDNLKRKIDNGAEYIITQMFFDNNKYFDFVEKCRKKGIGVPIIPGIKPLSTLKQLTVLPSVFSVNIPDKLVKLVSKSSNSPLDIREIGVEWAIEQSLELKKAGVPILHYYTMGKISNIEKVAKAIFLEK